MCSATQRGLKFTVDDNKVMQAYADIPAAAFQEFMVRCGNIEVRLCPSLAFFRMLLHVLRAQDESDKKVEFRVNLQTLYESLRLFGELTGRLILSYSTADKLLCITLEDRSINDKVIDTTFKLQTQDSYGGTIDYRFQDCPCNHTAIIKADDMKDALSELDWLGGSTMELVMSDSDPYFAIISCGECGQAQVEFPEDSEVFFRLDCTGEASAAYSTNMIQKVKFALSISDQVEVRMNEQGLLKMSCSTKAHGGHPAFVDFLINPAFDAEEVD